MSLQTYNKKRRFDVTPEPEGKVGRKAGNGFIVQKHDASRLHYDFRLELDGVMLSWAVTRGPSLVPGEKRLSIHVEDHPLDYATFEGTIPEGQYGGGTVMLWDRGTWQPEGDPRAGMKKGHLRFQLDGQKLKGAWHLVRLKKKPGDRQEPWLLIKSEDEAARGPKDPDILEEMPLSVKTGRDLDAIAAGKGKGGKAVWQSNHEEKTAYASMEAAPPKAKLKAGAVPAARKVAPVKKAKVATAKPRAKKAKAKTAKAKKAKRKSKSGSPPPAFVAPTLATLRERAPDGAAWVHEIKLDGYRIQSRLDDGEVALLTRKALDWAERFTRVADAVKALSASNALIDGEVVVLNEHGVSDFSGLQNALKEGEANRFHYYAFDLMHLDGEDLRGRQLIERKQLLKQLIDDSPDAQDMIRYSEHFEEDGPLVLDHACKMHLEGIISKRRDAPYVSGRSDTWVKAKCTSRQEFVVIGYSPSTATKRAIGALVLGYREDGKLRYGGRMGTGYTHAMAADLWKLLSPLEATKPPVEVPGDERRKDVKWLKPSVVVEADFRGWTDSGLVRQASFKGLREDKSPDEIIRETPAMPKKSIKNSKQTGKQASTEQRATTAKTAPKARTAKPDPAAGVVRLTNPDRVYWKDAGVTKQNLADFYTSIWDWIAPQVVNRPLSLLRCPDGAEGECFFQKHASAGLLDQRLRVVTDAKNREVLALEDLDGLLTLVQAGVLEIHVRGSMIDTLDLCDRIVFDLDPGEGVTWKEIVDAARDVRERLGGLKLETFVKLTGGKGLHVVLPIKGTDWETAKSFAQAVAEALAADDPKRYIAKMTKSLRDGRIFVDYLRNSLEQTAVAAFSTRARPGAPVSVPVTWEELGRVKAANQYTVLNLGRRLGGLTSDPWADIGRVKQKLPNFKA